MQRLICIVLLLIKTLSGSFAQTNRSIVADNLFSYDHPIATISHEEYKYVIPVSDPKENIGSFRQCLIRNGKGLFVAIIGTGRLYKAILKNKNLSFERIDTTVYFGSNFASFNFSYKDTLYSLGGYGFWKTNGLLRYYVEKLKQWEILKLNTEIPIHTEKEYDLIGYDLSDGKLYFGFTYEENNTTTNEKSEISYHYETMVLDLAKKEWKHLGTLSPFLKNNLPALSNITSSPWGEMISLNKKLFFLNYKENRIYQLSSDKQKIIEEFPSSTGDAHACYFRDSVFFSGISSRNLLDSISISRKDLISFNEKIYTPWVEGNKNITKSSEKRSINILLIAAVALIILIVADYFIRKKILKKNYSSAELKSNHILSHNIFTETETEVLKVITANSQKAMLTSIDELNKALGVTKKNIEVQKKQRSDVISSINKKYSYFKKGNGELIERKQAEFDKRSFEYYIDFSKLNEVNEFIQSSNSSNHS